VTSPGIKLGLVRPKNRAVRAHPVQAFGGVIKAPLTLIN
jgi:hypothetical protein